VFYGMRAAPERESASAREEAAMQRTAVRVGLTLFFTLSAVVGASAQEIKGGRRPSAGQKVPWFDTGPI
jgi:hypothetical protein